MKEIYHVVSLFVQFSKSSVLPQNDRRAKRRRPPPRVSPAVPGALEDRSLMAFNVLAEYATGTNPQRHGADPDRRGSQPDLVIVDSGDNSIGVRLGNADGTFGPSSDFRDRREPSVIGHGGLHQRRHCGRGDGQFG